MPEEAKATQLLDTAADAVKRWDSKLPITAIWLGESGADQRKVWGEVFDILRMFQDMKERRWTYSVGQFDSWCFEHHIGYPPGTFAKPNVPSTPAEVTRYYQIRGMAFAILREGYANVMDRKVGVPKIQVAKP